MVRFVVGVGLALLVLVGCYVLEGGNPLQLVGLTGFLISALMPLFGVLAVWKWSQWLQAWSHAFTKSAEAAQVQVSLAIWRFSEFACYLTGLVAWLAGAVIILNYLSQPEALTRWNLALAASLLGPVYGLFFGLVCRILRSRVEELHR